MNHSISQDFNFKSLIKFTLPTIIMMMFISVYSIVDGIFVSRYLGSNALSSLNIIYPIINVLLGIGIMMGTGSSSIITKKMGEGKLEEAYQTFSFISLVSIIIGFIFTLICSIFIEDLSILLGSNEILLKDCVTYLQIMLLFSPICMLQLLYQTFFVTASNPKLGLIATLIGGIANIVLDYFFMGILHMGVEGAAIATGIGQSLSALIGLVFFFTNKQGLHYTTPKYDFHILWKSCTNGASEMVSNISSGFITFLFNIIMLDMLGEPGVAAITIALYAQFLFNGLYIGFSTGVAPIFSYNFGSKNTNQIKKIYKICIRFICISSIIILSLSFISSPFLIGIFTPKTDPTYNIAVHGFYFFALNFLFAGINIFSSALFTAFSNGKVSAIISFLRTFVFITLCLFILPKIIGIDGVWLAIPLAELLTLFVSLIYLKEFKSIYNYA